MACDCRHREVLVGHTTELSPMPSLEDAADKVVCVDKGRKQDLNDTLHILYVSIILRNSPKNNKKKNKKLNRK